MFKVFKIGSMWNLFRCMIQCLKKFEGYETDTVITKNKSFYLMSNLCMEVEKTDE